ncbi:MAG: prepilin-type N-terminal cleavage/methylation domain-containing protein [Fuerstiella sp.]
MKRNSKQFQQSTRRGFTLVEMLISVTLVLLMMTLFSAIFQMATSSMTVQRGVAATDQKARSLTTNLRADLAKRTFRYCQPYYPTESAAIGATAFGDRAGYIYISTNDPFSEQDDLLQFTVSADQTAENVDDSQYLGRSELLYDLAADPAFGNSVRNTTLRFNPNQPDADDADLFSNKVASSPAAEVTYYVRGGNLYRRIMLLRSPLPVAGEDLTTEPASSAGNNYFQPGVAHSTSEFGGVFSYVNSPLAVNQTTPGDTNHFNLAADEVAPDDWQLTATNDFWRHFDFSAVPINPAGFTVPNDVAFVGIGALDNGNTAPTAITLGDPRFRFGFNALNGLSREHDNSLEWQFIGRFTHAETSHRYFNWPLAAARVEALGEDEHVINAAGTTPLSVTGALGNINVGTDFLGDDGSGGDGNGNPMDIAGTQLHLNTDSGVISELIESVTGRGGERAVEDLLLANVQSMKIEIWDERLARFVTPGHSTAGAVTGSTVAIQGDYHLGRRANVNYGPRGTIASLGNRVFDTWTPRGSTFNFDGNATAGEVGERQAPFTPYRYYPPRLSDSPSGPSPDTMTDPATEVDSETGVATNLAYWRPLDTAGTARNTYAVGDVVFAVPSQFVARGVTGWDADDDGSFSWDLDQSTFLLDGIGTRTIPNPGFPPQGFQIAYRCVAAGSVGDAPPNWPRVPGQRFAESVPVGFTPAQWISIDNRRPLKTLRVTVQFFDQNTEKLRQLSLTLPLTTER